ncbi:MAG: Fic family protein, partial [Proteobacteria bacterium]|nr:Fic family protein [Pseudomonadota bacterium]
MNREDYRAPEAGRFIQVPEGHLAFVPVPLPPAIDFDASLVLALSRADTALSELSGVGRLLPNPHLLIAPYLRREAVLSSRIEGTRANLDDVLLDEADDNFVAEDPGDVLEVRNYVTALEFGLERLATLPLSLRLVRELHGKLMQGPGGNNGGDNATPGEFRRSQNWIGSAGSKATTASYVPPPPAEMRAALNEWETFLHQRDTLPDLIQCALMHEHFEAIHPFLDGNGRVGRLLITLFLIERGRLSQPLLYLSEYIEANRQQYYDCLHRIRTEGDWRNWLIYFLRGVTETANHARAHAARLMNLREQLRAEYHDISRSAPLIDALFINP